MLTTLSKVSLFLLIDAPVSQSTASHIVEYPSFNPVDSNSVEAINRHEVAIPNWADVNVAIAQLRKGTISWRRRKLFRYQYSAVESGNGEVSKSVLLICPSVYPVRAVAIDQKQAVAQIEKMERALSGLPADK